MIEEPSLTDPACQPKNIRSLLGLKRELEDILRMCGGISTGQPDTFWQIANRLEPAIDFIDEERRRQRKKPS